MLSDGSEQEICLVNVFSEVVAMIRRAEIKIARRNAMSIVDWREYDQWKKTRKLR